MASEYICYYVIAFLVAVLVCGSFYIRALRFTVKNCDKRLEEVTVVDENVSSRDNLQSELADLQVYVTELESLRASAQCERERYAAECNTLRRDNTELHQLVRRLKAKLSSKSGVVYDSEVFGESGSDHTLSEKDLEELDRLRDFAKDVSKERMFDSRILRMRKSAIRYVLSDFLTRKITSANDFVGVYVLWNVERDWYYVGQSIYVFKRVKEHFGTLGTGGSQDLYLDYKQGYHFVVEFFSLEKSKFRDLNDLERSLIDYYDSYHQGYNRTKGNRDLPENTFQSRFTTFDNYQSKVPAKSVSDVQLVNQKSSVKPGVMVCKTNRGILERQAL